MTAHVNTDDRQQILDTLTRYFAAVDDHRLDTAIAEATFTPDAQYVRPNGVATTGPAAIRESQQSSFARFRETHHVMTDHLVDFDTDGCVRVRANLTAMHLWADDQGDARALSSHFLAGGVIEVIAQNTDGTWKIARLELRPVWRDGAGFGAVAGTR